MPLKTGGSSAAGQFRTNIFTKNLIGRLQVYNPGAAYTVNCTMEVEADYMAIRIALPNISANAANGVKVSISAGTGFNASSSVNDVTPPGGAFTAVTWGGAASVNLPARLYADVPSFTYSDLISLKSLARTDGGTRPIICVRVEYPSGVDISIPQHETYGWRGAGIFRQMRAAVQAVLGVTTPTAFTSTVAVDTLAMIPAVQYTSTKTGKQVLFTGDSIAEGYGNGTRSFGATARACVALSTPVNPIEYFDAAQAGQAPLVYSRCIENYQKQVNPTIVVYSPYSINDVPAGGMTATSYANLYTGLGRVLNSAMTSNQQSKLLLLEALPCNPSFRATAAGDQLRRDLNVLLGTFTGMQVMRGYADSISAGQDANGQTLITTGLDIDGAHLSELGYNTAAIPLKQYISAA